MLLWTLLRLCRGLNCKDIIKEKGHWFCEKNVKEKKQYSTKENVQMQYSLKHDKRCPGILHWEKKSKLEERKGR